MRRLFAIAVLAAGIIAAAAAGYSEPPRPQFRPQVDDTPQSRKGPPAKIEPAPELIPAQSPAPKSEPSPMPVPAALPDAPPIAPPPIEVLPPVVIDRGPLFVDLQTISPPGLGLEVLEPPGIGPAGEHPFCYRINPNNAFVIDGLFRAYYRNDQRIEWSGLEETFGAEGVLRPGFVTRSGNWLIEAQGEFFVNQPYGSSRLRDATRDLFHENFNVDTFEIFQLFIEATYGDFSVRAGRSRTPFGRYQSPMFTNSLQDAPFLRTEIIGFSETGLFLRYRPRPFVIDAAIVNGEPDLDTNSSKAFVSRIGYEESWWTVGVSAKIQDGIGSEYQKRNDTIYGVDASVALGPFLVYGEGAYYQHGFNRNPADYANFSPYNLGVRSLYGLDVFAPNGKVIGSTGCYAGLTYRADRWLVDASYGYFRPERIGDPVHDDPTSRFMLKAVYSPGPHLDLFFVGLIENRRTQIGVLNSMHPRACIVGMQYGF
jgi:hypothetical protein